MVEKKTRVTENGRTVLIEIKYRGVQEENGKFRILAYFAKRMPLNEVQMAEQPKDKCKMEGAA